MGWPAGRGIDAARRGGRPVTGVHGDRLGAAAALGALLLGACAAAVAPDPETPQPAPPVEVGHLLKLRGDTLSVHYSPGTLDRASHVQRRLRSLTEELASWELPAGAGALVLSPEHWAAALPGHEYGLPALAGALWVAAPAQGGERLVALWRELGVAPPALGRDPLVGTAQEAGALALADVALLPLLARSWLASRELDSGDAALDEALAQLVALVAASRAQLVEAAPVEAAWTALAERPPVEPARSLSPPARELVATARARRSAQATLERHGPGAVRRWLSQRAASGGRFDRQAVGDRFPELVSANAG
jgi:hypothetical protein